MPVTKIQKTFLFTTIQKYPRMFCLFFSNDSVWNRTSSPSFQVLWNCLLPQVWRGCRCHQGIHFGVFFPVEIRNALLKQISSSSPLTTLSFTPWDNIRAHELDPFWLQEVLCWSTSNLLPLLTAALSLQPGQSSCKKPFMCMHNTHKT